MEVLRLLALLLLSRSGQEGDDGVVGLSPPAPVQRNAGVHALTQEELDGTRKVPKEETDSPIVSGFARILWAYSWGSIGAGESTSRAVSAETLDTRRDLGLGSGAPFVEADVWVYLGNSDRIRFHGFYGRHRARTTLGRDFSYDDDTFSAGQRVSSEINMSLLEAGYERRVIDAEEASTWVGIGLRRSYFNAGIPQAPTAQGGDKEEVVALVPYLRLASEVRLGTNFSLMAEVEAGGAGLPLGSAEPADSRFLDAGLFSVWRPAQNVALQAGARFLWISQRFRGEEADADFGANKVHLRLLGPTFGITISF